MKKLIFSILLLNLFIAPLTTFAVDSTDQLTASSTADPTINTDNTPTLYSTEQTSDQTALMGASNSEDQPLLLDKTSASSESVNPDSQTLKIDNLATPMVDGATATTDLNKPSTSYALISFFILMVVTALILVKSKSMKDSLTKKK